MSLPLIYLLLFVAIFLAGWSMTTLLVTLGPQRLRQTRDNIDNRLRSLFLFSNPHRLLFGYLAVLILVPAVSAWLAQSAVLFVLCVIALLYLPGFVFRFLENKRHALLSSGLPDVLDQMAATMLSGGTLTSAMQAIADDNKGPLGQEFTLLLRENRLGTPLEDALENLGERVKSEDMDLVITASLIAREVGGNLGETFRRLSGTLRRKLEVEGKIKALTSQGVLQGRVVSFLPFAFIGILWVFFPDYIDKIFHCLLGWIVLGMVLLLEFFGAMLIRKIVRITI